MQTRKNISEKGLATQKTIYNKAKELFQRKGYKKAKMADIAMNAKVPLGSVTYYFKTKDALAHMIFSDYMDNIIKRLCRYDWYVEDSTLFRYVMNGYIYYMNIFKEPASLKFYYEVLQIDACTTFYSEEILAMYKGFVDEYNVNTTEEEFAACSFFDLGARREFWINYIDGKCKLDLNTALKKAILIMPLLLEIPYDEIDRIRKKCEKAISEIGDVNISILGK